MVKIKIGIVGAGTVSQQYLDNLVNILNIDVVMISDIDLEKAESRAKEYNIKSFGSVQDLLLNPEIEIVLNLTTPTSHEDITIKSLKARKHVWSEKPLALNTDGVIRIKEASEKSGYKVGCAPDTFLSPWFKAGLDVINQGKIGKVVSATTAFEISGPEDWHPNPEFLYSKGGGPVFDVGPYYLTALVSVFGPVTSVFAKSNKAREYRVIGSGPKAGKVFPVEVQTNVFSILQFGDGQISQSSFSFDSTKMRSGVLEIHGTEGTLVLPDPNWYEGSLQIYRRDKIGEAPEEIFLDKEPGYRGVGLVEMIRAIRSGREPEAGLALSGHIVQIIQAIEESSIIGEEVKIQPLI
jgi:predicted dehydrogenase